MPSYHNTKEVCLYCEREITISTFGRVYKHLKHKTNVSSLHGFCPASGHYFGNVFDENTEAYKRYKRGR